MLIPNAVVSTRTRDAGKERVAVIKVTNPSLWMRGSLQILGVLLQMVSHNFIPHKKEITASFEKKTSKRDFSSLEFLFL